MRSRSSSPRGSLFRTLAVLVVAVAALAVSCQSSTSDDAQVRDRAVGQHLQQRMDRQMDERMGPAMMGPTYFAQYGTDTHAYKPRRLNPSVDGSLFVTGMRWKVWGTHRAVGAGTAHVNDCDPSCVDGHYSKHRVTVRLGRPRELCDSRFFTSIRLDGRGYHHHGHFSGVGCR